ncbi:MAG: hypothetical protein Q3M30_16150 [Candidatus Electrothrix sp. Rat3]|nr:hypothetical protein [Candidatus Electrothrix rattekaaiensis]
MTEWKNDLVQHRINRAEETLEDAHILAQAQHTLIVGLGNPILGDDSVGWRVAKKVSKQGSMLQ